jgi:hypothetical protein
MNMKLFGFLFGLLFAFAPFAVADAYTAGYGGVVTTPYWCGSYWSSQPCYQSQYYQQNTQPYGQNYGYGYYDQYSQNNSYNIGYTNNTGGYWGYCYQSVAPGYGPSYRYSCWQQYNPNYQYNYYNYPYNPGVGQW